MFFYHKLNYLFRLETMDQKKALSCSLAGPASGLSLKVLMRETVRINLKWMRMETQQTTPMGAPMDLSLSWTLN